MRRDVFQAIADPTRREIIHLLSKGEMNLNAIAGNFEMSRPAISQQVKILVECGLIEINQMGRERLCHVRLQKLREASQWLNKYRAFWAQKLDALEDFLEHEPKKNKKKHSKKKKHEKKKRSK
jgi:DNA-binding transcriptional ArsR family regulator